MPVPNDVKVGDVFVRNGGWSNMVFIGKVTPENVKTFLDLKIQQNELDTFNETTLKDRPFVFIIFDHLYNEIYIDNISEDSTRIGRKLVNFKYEQHQEKTEKIVNKMKEESKKMKMEVGNVYAFKGWDGVAICLEHSSDLKFKNVEKFKDLKIDNIDNPFMCLLYHTESKFTSLSFYDSIFLSNMRIKLDSQLVDFDFQTMNSPWREIVLEILNKKDEVKKCFRINKATKEVHCFEGQTKVKWSNENDKRELISMGSSDELFEKTWPILNIDFPTYLLLTGLSERTKEDELLEIKGNLLSIETLGCQTAELTPIVDQFISLLHKLYEYQKGLPNSHKNQVISVMDDVLKVMRANKDIPTDIHFSIAKSLILDYAKKLVE